MKFYLSLKTAEIFKSHLNINNDCIEDNNLINESSSENENDVNFEETNELLEFVPHFGETSNNFELDNCGGHGKVLIFIKI